MSIVRKDERTLIDDVVLGIDKTKNSNLSNKISEKVKKSNFFVSTYLELKKVKWPTFTYTVVWSTIVIVFALVLSAFVMFFDSIFESTFKYVDCTSSVTKGESSTDTVRSCSKDYLNRLVFKEVEDKIQDSQASETVNQ